MDEQSKSKRGFAGMTPEQRREIASRGGKSAHAQGKAHRFTSDEARVAGKIGGQKLVATLGREHMQSIGRNGGNSRADKKLRDTPQE